MLMLRKFLSFNIFFSALTVCQTVCQNGIFIEYVKASAPNRAEALKIMRFLGLVASQGGLFHLPENTFLKKVLQKRLNTKIFISDKPEFCGAIGAGLFAVDSDRLLERLECNALNINPKNLVILIGTNDIGIGVPTEYTLKNIKEILQRTQTLCSNTAVKSSIRA